MMTSPEKPLGRMLSALVKRLPLGSRLDAWVNNVTGIGTTYDKSTFGFVLPSIDLTDQEISSLYHSDDMAARMINVVPQEMFREPFSINTGDPGLDEAITDKFESLNVRGHLADGVRWGRCYGGGAVLIGADDGRDAALPLNPERAKDLSYLHTVDRRLLWPLSFYDEPGPKMGKPETFSVTTVAGRRYQSAIVHESRLLIFGGAPTGIHERQQRQGWEISYLQRAYDVLRGFHTGWKAVEQLLTDGNQAVFRMSGLAEAIGAGNEEALRKRLQIVELYRSVMRAMVIDADLKEDFTRQATSYAELPGVLEKIMLRLAAAVEIPVTILMGQSPAGMNATGESDFRWFYDRIRALQHLHLTPALRYLVSIWLRSRGAPTKKQPRTITVKYPALWTDPPLVQAQRESAIATRDSVYIQAQVLLPDEVALARFRPGGFDDEILLSDEGIAARKLALKGDLDKLGEDPEQVPANGPPNVRPGGTSGAALAAPPPDGAGPEGEVRTDSRAHAKLPQALALAGDRPSDIRVLVALCTTHGRLDADEPRTFELFRSVDETGVSGTGVVAYGVVFDDGTVALRWCTKNRSTTLFDSIDQLLSVHGHGGKSEVRYLDDERADASDDCDALRAIARKVWAQLDRPSQARVFAEFMRHIRNDGGDDDDVERDELGRFAPKGGGTGGSGTPKDAPAHGGSETHPAAQAGQHAMAPLLDAIKSKGGFTYNPSSGEQPSTGYALSLIKGREEIHDFATFTGDHLADYILKNRDALAQEGAHVGAWHNKSDGKLYLDCSVVVKSEDDAWRLGQANEQLAYFDLAQGKEITLGTIENGTYVPTKRE